MAADPATVAKSGFSARVEAPGRGIACMIGGGLLLTLNDAVVKWLSGDLPLGEILLLRGLGALTVIALVLLWRRDVGALRVRFPWAQVVRASLMVAGTFLFVSGLRRMPLADCISLAFIGPIFVTALAPVFLGEQVGWRRWLAVLVGFAGVVVMLRPGGDSLNWAALLPVSAALTGAFRDLLTRRISASESTLTTLLYSTLGVTLAGGLTAPLGWQTPAIGDLGLLALAGLFLCGAHFLHIETFRFAEAALVTPFKYVSLLWGVVIGFLLWADVPDRWTVAGACLVIGSGLFILHRERRRAAVARVANAD
ncbi:MAG: DMT family transporter [Alphaproteobacteria bacterium]|nr:DMT family transporter [Alphaproteobacteria bacterium]MDP6816000.1 DMT family transporter [Alphaproteobacteria bacterium]